MSAPTFHIEVLGDVVLERTLLRWGHNAADLSESWDTILDHFEDLVADQFSSHGSAMGTPWPPLKAATVAAKAAAGYPEPSSPLVATGALRLSFKQGGPDHVRHVTADSAEWGSRNAVAMFHHGRARSGPVPRRPLFELDEIRKRWVVSVLHRGVFDARVGVG